jgi:hypothetical protein
MDAPICTAVRILFHAHPKKNMNAF